MAIYQTLTQAQVLIPTVQWNQLLKGFSESGPDTVMQLVAQGILKSKEMDDAIVFNQWRDRLVHDFDSLTSKVLVTRKCNLRCTYCIIDKEAKVMSGDTARRMDTFYLERIKAKKPRQVRDNYLGGEPLLNLNRIVESTTRRFYFCKGMEIDYGFSITTNGTLITTAGIAKLKRVGLSAINLSLAGPQPIHDKLRPMNGNGTYEAIVSNLEAISGITPIHIECQYDAGSRDYRRIPDMLTDLKARNIEVAGISFTPIFAKRRSNRFCSGMGDVDKHLFLMQAAARHGLASNNGPPTNTCMADFRSVMVFDTDGTILPCPALQSGEMAYGDVVNGIDFVAESLLLARRLPQKCLQQCELLPICMGGCRLQALTRTGDFNGIDCPYPTYRRLLEAYILGNAETALAHHCRAA